MEAKYTPDHPDVKKLKDTIAKMEQMNKDQAESKADDANPDDDKRWPLLRSFRP